MDEQLHSPKYLECLFYAPLLSPTQSENGFPNPGPAGGVLGRGRRHSGTGRRSPRLGVRQSGVGLNTPRLGGLQSGMGQEASDIAW